MIFKSFQLPYMEIFLVKPLRQLYTVTFSFSLCAPGIIDSAEWIWFLQENRFTKCDICVKLKQTHLDKEQQVLLQGEFKEHIEKVEYVTHVISYNACNYYVHYFSG